MKKIILSLCLAITSQTSFALTCSEEYRISRHGDEIDVNFHNRSNSSYYGGWFTSLTLIYKDGEFLRPEYDPRFVNVRKLPNQTYRAEIRGTKMNNPNHIVRCEF